MSIQNKEKRIQNNIRQFVTPFVKSLGDETLSKAWNNVETQKKFAAFVNSKLQSSSDEAKKPLNKYILFGLDLRKVLKKENIDPKMYLKEISERWKVLPEKEKEKYVQLAATEKVRYEAERHKDNDSNPTDEKKEKKPPTISPYSVFTSQEKLKIMNENPGMSKKDAVTEINNRWKDIKQNKEKYSIYESLSKMNKLSLEDVVIDTPVVPEIVVATPVVVADKVKKVIKKKKTKVATENYEEDEK